MKTYELNKKLVEKFGASPLEDMEEVPGQYCFENGLVYSHRGFDEFYERLLDGEKSAIVSGVNASGTLHMGHKVVFDINKYFQREHGVDVYIPISDDESYVSGKVDSQEEGLENAISLAKEMIGYGFDPEKTFFIIDYKCPEIYNVAFKLSRFVTMSTIKATYGYEDSDNPGLHFYPCVQSSHVLLPQLREGTSNVLVPIGPDEDVHLRIARDIAPKVGVEKPKVLHTRFLPGLDGNKMSKSRNNAIYLRDTGKELKKKVHSALSGGGETLEEHREHGGVPEEDMSCIYLKTFFYDDEESAKLYKEYREGTLLTGEVKKALYKELESHNTEFVTSADSVSEEDVRGMLYQF